jgi:hypothetical protein
MNCLLKTMVLVAILALQCYTIIAQSNSAKQYSKIWGKEGESWDRQRIPDFTHAGYKSCKEPIPNFRQSVNVKDFGAKGDGVTDDIKAFRAAIQKCANNGAVYIPAGKYLLSDTLVIGKSNICIRGADENSAIVFFTKGLEQLYPNYNKEHRNQTSWSWSGAMILFKGDIENIGIENLTIMFPDSAYAGHNFHERGYNGVGFSSKAHFGWVRNLDLVNADLGLWIDSSGNHITAENWKLTFGPVRAAQKISGHHGVNIYGGYNLLEHFEVDGKFVHDLSVESDSSKYNVFRDGKGKDICIDHHNHAQRNNLFTHIDAGIGSRIYVSGGISTPAGVSFNETYWNITADNNLRYCDQYNDATMRSTNNVSVGIKTSLPANTNNADNNWFETIAPSVLLPKDLYEAQMEFVKRKIY